MKGEETGGVVLYGIKIYFQLKIIVTIISYWDWEQVKIDVPIHLAYVFVFMAAINQWTGKVNEKHTAFLA